MDILEKAQSVIDEELKKGKKDNKNFQTSFFEDKTYFAEQIFNTRLNPKNQFLLWNKFTKQVQVVEGFEAEIEGRNKIVTPFNLPLIEKGVVSLPSELRKIDEAELDSKILKFIRKWLDIEEFYEYLCLYYIKMTWAYDRLSVVPYLRALGDFGSGKTRFIQTIGSLCYKPMFLAGATSDAYLFRIIELFKGTMVLNELERVNTDLSSQIVNILNNGFEKGFGVGRIEGDKSKTPAVYDVFSPKLFSAREPFKDLALESRIITVRLFPTSRKDLPSLLDDSFWAEAQEIRNSLLAYRMRVCLSKPRTETQNNLASSTSSDGVISGFCGS